MLKGILQADQYGKGDLFIRDIIDETIRREVMIHEGEVEVEGGKGRKGKTSQEQGIINLKNSENKFENMNAFEVDLVDYQEDQVRKRARQYELVEPPRFKVIGYTFDRGSKVIRKPILKLSDLYITYNPRIQKIIQKIFERHIYGKAQRKQKSDRQAMLLTRASNAQQLEQILKSYQANEDDYNFDNKRVDLCEEELENYVIDRTHSKENYFLYYKQQRPPTQMARPHNIDLRTKFFLRNLHRETKLIQRFQKSYASQVGYKINEEGQEDETTSNSQWKKNRESRKIAENGEDLHKRDELKRQQEPKKLTKLYFGQFRRAKYPQEEQKRVTLSDQFNSIRQEQNKSIAQSVLDYFSYIDPEIASEGYKRPIQECDRLELNLSNPHFFLTKLHTVFDRSHEALKENEYRNRLAEANKGGNLSNPGDKSFFSGQLGLRGMMGKHVSIGGSEGGDGAGAEEDSITIQKVIETEIKNVYKQPLKHSELATKFEFVKFTFEEEAFVNYHRYYFPFHEHLTEKVRVQVAIHKARKLKPNGLVINAEMKESNQKFSRREDLSVSRGEFILVEYIQEVPLLLSDVGMCQRMFIQVNYLQVLQKMRADHIQSKSIQEMEEERDKRGNNSTLKFEKNCELWRKTIRQLFGDNGKQVYWEPKLAGKLIGIPDGPGVTLMESNLATVPIVRKNTKGSRDFLLVREGSRWVIRRIDNLYVSGQIQPHKKVFYPNSRQHSEFKTSYERAFIVRHLKQYGFVTIEQLKTVFPKQNEQNFKKLLKMSNAVSKDQKTYVRGIGELGKAIESQLVAEDICLYERMMKSQADLGAVGIIAMKTNEKMKNVLKQFSKKHFLSHQKISIARMIRQQLQLTSWYLTDSFLKYKQKASKIEINGFADPTNGKGGYSYINKPQKQRTSKQDMEEKAERQKGLPLSSDLRKLNCESSRELLRRLGHNADQIQEKGRWQLIRRLKSKEGTEYSRRERETKTKKIENQRREISKNFNRLLAYLTEPQETHFIYNKPHTNTLNHYMQKQRQAWEKILKKYSKGDSIKEQHKSDDSEDDDD